MASAKIKYPSVCVVDTHATRPPVPPRLIQVRKKTGVAQILLFMLVSVALCGMVIEACFIYGLYQAEHVSITISVPFAISFYDFLLAHCLGKNSISLTARNIMFQELKIEKEGYYYVYSKVFFSDSNGFQHRISMHTDRYSGNITLLQSRKYPSHSKVSQKTQSNSYLGGVFHLYKDDGIFVDVSDTAKIVRHKPSENVFGAYMI
uniref:THD domain-containing protein n=1 Tax=Pundamilia nyererei TaxID=303518 RepID=A0A3B4FNW2_9CICH